MGIKNINKIVEYLLLPKAEVHRTLIENIKRTA